MKQVFAPGCALLIYKPHLAAKVLAHLDAEIGGLAEHLTCCRHAPGLEAGTRVINTCPGCDRRYRELYDGISTVSLWELLAESDRFPFPDYGGATMAIQDACPTRTETRVHDAVRRLLQRMNVTLVEPQATRTETICCGDSFHGEFPVERVTQLMTKRADAMPATDVAVYCVSCVKAMHIGGRRPRYLVDLLFDEETQVGTFAPAAWHAMLDEFIAAH